MWRVPREVLASRDDERAMGFVLEQLQDPDAFLDKVRRLYAEPEAESFDTLRFRDGRVFERYSLPQRLAGEVVGRVWSFRDVTERARAEEAMARLVAIIEATPDFVGTCDALGHALYVNRAGRRMVGLGPEEPLAERHIAEFHPAAAAARLLEEAIPMALREGAWSGENALRHEDGREIPVLQVVLAHRSPGGEVDFLSTIARDISQRIEAEQLLRRSHTMAALGSLVAGVAHEVRNPLFGISSTLDAFEARFKASGDHRQYVQVLREQLDRLTHLMNDLLEYAKPTRLELQQGRLEDVVADAIGACAPLAEAAAVSIDTRLAPDLPPLPMDERRLGQVFRNLLENAVQHSPRSGRIRIDARLVHQRWRRLRRVLRRGRRPRLREPGPAAPVRALLHPPSRRHRPRPVHRPQNPLRPRRLRRRRQPRGRRRAPHALAPRGARSAGLVVTAPRWTTRRTTLWATAAVVAALALLEASVLPRDAAQRTSDALQLLLALGAAFACLLDGAARRRHARARSGRRSVSDAWRGPAARLFWVARAGPFSPEATYPEADVLFTASTALFLVAYVLRPGRERTLATAIDVVVVAIAMLYAYCEIALVHQLAGDAVAYEAWSTFVFDLRGLAAAAGDPVGHPLLRAPLEGPARPARPGLRAAADRQRRQQPGLRRGDRGCLPPGLLRPAVDAAFRLDRARGRGIPSRRAAELPRPASRPTWQRARRATVMAFVSVLLFPLLHILVGVGRRAAVARRALAECHRTRRERCSSPSSTWLGSCSSCAKPRRCCARARSATARCSTAAPTPWGSTEPTCACTT